MFLKTDLSQLKITDTKPPHMELKVETKEAASQTLRVEVKLVLVATRCVRAHLPNVSPILIAT